MAFSSFCLLPPCKVPSSCRFLPKVQRLGGIYVFARPFDALLISRFPAPLNALKSRTVQSKTGRQFRPQ